MRSRLCGWQLMVCTALAACGGGVPPVGTDAGSHDSGVGRDAGADAGLAVDAGRVDAGVDAGTPDAGPSTCAVRSTCSDTLPNVGAAAVFRSTASRLIAAVGSARHRGRDLFVKQGAPVYALARFGYGPTDGNIADEDVDVYLLRSCDSGAAWKKVGTYRTTDGSAPEVMGVADAKGRVYADLSGEQLPVGRHRVHFVVKGDLTTADQYIEVVPDAARFVVTDVDGTLTSSEYASWTDYIGGPPPQARAGAADALQALAKKGFYIFYLTARPEWLEPKTLEWVSVRGFPPGIVHTTLGGLGISGQSAIAFKTGELNWLLAQTGQFPQYGLGNRDTDVAAYSAAMIPNTYYYELSNVDLRGGVSHADYGVLAAQFSLLPAQCQ